ncbi:hypothetical protein [uncultured Polaribacter sp.]|uniref:hypothetical protein n=1 Tax=uncultured Polaribacter sp. TaxID=174711 RepID=UPI0026357BCD|nr:hypothetical protein [uncultured Polaribacter sp.]
MKTIKKFTTVLAIASLLFVSCDKAKEKKTDMNSSDTNTTEMSIEAKKMKVKIADGQYGSYNVDVYGDLSFDDWDGFNIANKELRDIENLELNTTTQRIENLNGTIANLGNSIPVWLRNEEVMEDVDDVQEEYRKLLKEKDEPMKNVKQNLEELIEKFDDLREELNETIAKYKKS